MKKIRCPAEEFLWGSMFTAKKCKNENGRRLQRLEIAGPVSDCKKESSKMEETNCNTRLLLSLFPSMIYISAFAFGGAPRLIPRPLIGG